jgi:methionine synthase II (cobalamin-independent)
MLRTFSALTIRWGNAVPSDIELLFHLCYGDNAHRHVVEPASLDVPVDFANALAAGIGRSIQLIHMPVPRGRADDAYFVPLKRLALRSETRICLGLVHHTDGVAGTRHRIAVARKYLDDFLVSTECGFGRRPPDTIAELLAIHAEIAGLPALA